MDSFTGRNFYHFRLPFIALCSALALCACGGRNGMAQAPPNIVSTPSVNGPVPVTKDSRIYNAAADARVPLDLPALGYAEQEYLFSGKANVYSWAQSGDVTVTTPNAPYTTRMLVRRPSDPARFSGTVWIEFMNSVSRIDEAMAWGYSNYYIMDHGDAYVGISAVFDGDVFATLKKFDAKRYASVSMANPAPLPGGCKEAGNSYFAETEPGLRWDMLSQGGALLKSNAPGRPLSDLKVQRVFVFGQSNGDLATYIAAFANHANLPSGKPVFDGYLMKDSGVPMRVSQCDPRPSQEDPRRVFTNIKSPVMQVVVENTVANNAGSRRPDSDKPGDQYRRYEIPGASHVDPYVMYWLPKPEILASVGLAPLWPQSGCFPKGTMNDFPIHYYMSGAMANLDAWVRDGIAPPHADFIQTTGQGLEGMKVVKDANGNALGGVRDAYVEVPTASYQQPKPCAENRTPNWQYLESKYGSYSSYQAKWDAAVDRDVKERWIPQAYAARIKAGNISMPTQELEKKPQGRPRD